MYEDTYQNLCKANLACEHPEPKCRNKSEEMVESEEHAFCCKSKHELILPDCLLFVDEYGTNTPQTKDGQVFGQLYLCSVEGWSQNWAATKDAYFTTASGIPSICDVIYAAKGLKDK
jgi:hypothetical protein